jgi:hypothetical protein
MASRRDETALAGVYELLPERYQGDELRGQFDRLERYLDRLLFLDHTAELAVDRDTFLALCGDEELVPAEIQDIFILETAKYVGRRIKTFESKGRRITWREGAKYGLLPMTGAAEVLERGYTRDMSDDEMRQALRESAPPGIKLAEDSLDHLNGPAGRAYLIKRLRHNRSFWDCIVANLGWWAAINFGASSVVFLLLVASGVPWPAALWMAAGFQTLFTAYIFGSCLVNSQFYIWR